MKRFAGIIFGLLALVGIAAANPPATQQPLMLSPAGGGPIGTPVSLGALANGASSVGSIALTAGANILAGDTVVVVVGAFNTNVAVSGVSDGTNTYTKAAETFGGASYISIWYRLNAAAVTSPTITATFGTNGGFANIAAARVTGILTSGALDKAVTNFGASGTGTVATGTLAQANEVVFGGWNANATKSGESGGFTALASASSTTSIDLAYQIVSATTTVTYGPTWSAAGGWSNAVVSFKGF